MRTARPLVPAASEGTETSTSSEVWRAKTGESVMATASSAAQTRAEPRVAGITTSFHRDRRGRSAGPHTSLTAGVMKELNGARGFDKAAGLKARVTYRCVRSA